MPKPSRPFPVALIVRGSLITLRRKCGTKTCRCAAGNPHETPALSYSLGGATKMLTLRVQDVREIRAALKRYQKAVESLEREALAGILAFRLRAQDQKAAVRSLRQ